ncbi:hypothetical protein CCO03_10300 [Comamonas serinivorans]|uniref:Uncharacterized protein n=1 Tax=Comamonas serinivorans TaxID=1082851 RepID=A0A1Y0ENZ3_9BURK|nr:hypothetical protein [Comamonas serinivorans]ARU05022.1 hypothetical protein CCO03_10300 [Comamonas serinivorans]
MSRVDVPESAPNAAPSGPAPRATPPRQPGRRLWRIVLGLVLGLLALLVAAVLGLWVWAGQDGSLATVLRLAGAQVPLVSENAQGSLRRGGTVDKLVWDKDGVRAEVEGATLLWQPLALLQGQLQIDTLSARRIAVRSEPKDEPTPPSGPPQSLSLPLGIEVKSIAADEFVWEGPPEVVARHFAGSYRYDRVQHALKLDRLEVMDGAYRGEAQVGVVGAPTLKVQLEGVVASPMPEGQAPLPLRASVDIQGPLDAFELALKVAADPSALAELPDEVRAKLAESTADAGAGAPGPAAAASKASSTGSASDTRQQPADASPADAEQPSLSATGTVTPWQAPFVSTLDARFQALDVGAFLAQAPRTHLSGALTLAPLAADTPIEPAAAGTSAAPAAGASTPGPGASAGPGASSQPASTASAPSGAAGGSTGACGVRSTTPCRAAWTRTGCPSTACVWTRTGATASPWCVPCRPSWPAARCRPRANGGSPWRSMRPQSINLYPVSSDFRLTMNGKRVILPTTRRHLTWASGRCTRSCPSSTRRRFTANSMRFRSMATSRPKGMVRKSASRAS